MVPGVHLHQELMRDVVLLWCEDNDVLFALAPADAFRHRMMLFNVAVDNAPSGTFHQAFIAGGVVHAAMLRVDAIGFQFSKGVSLTAFPRACP